MLRSAGAHDDRDSVVRLHARRTERARRVRFRDAPGRAQRLLIVVDQFEELFTMVDDAEARRFLDACRGAASATGHRSTSS